MPAQSTLEMNSGKPPILGYRYETRILAGPDNDRPISNWIEKLTSWPPDKLKGNDDWGSEIRTVEKLVPAGADDPVIAYHHKHETSGGLESKITEFDPHELDYPVSDVIALTTLEESDFTNPYPL